MNTKHTPTPLSRAQKRLEYWREQLASRKNPRNSMSIGSVGVSIQEDKKLDRELIANAEAAVKDWEEVVRAVNSHEALLEAAKNGLEALRQFNTVHFTEDVAPEIKQLEKAITQAEARP